MSKKQNSDLQNNETTPTTELHSNSESEQSNMSEQPTTSRKTLQEQQEEISNQADELMAKLLGILEGKEEQ